MDAGKMQMLSGFSNNVPMDDHCTDRNEKSYSDNQKKNVL